MNKKHWVWYAGYGMYYFAIAWYTVIVFLLGYWTHAKDTGPSFWWNIIMLVFMVISISTMRKTLEGWDGQ